MSYIGKNPKVDSVKLDGSATVPTGAAVEGQLYFNTGTGAISEGLKVYKNAQYVSIDKQLGDADTIELLKASDVGGLQWKVAINSTSTTVGMNSPVPQYNATATGFANASSTFANSSTGNALLTNESADIVFAYESHTVDSKNDYFGIQVDVPKAFRGGNLVLQFEYRTAEASGASSDNDFLVSIQDGSTGNYAQTTNSTTTGSQAAGTSVAVASSTGFAVGDRVRVESGTAASGNSANSFTEAYVTAIADSTHLTFSETIVFPASGTTGIIASGWLTDQVPGQLKEADSDTNKVGKVYSIQFKTEEDTDKLNITFMNQSTTAAGIDIFIDNILLSANKFLQVSSQTKTESYLHTYATSFWSGTGTVANWNKALLVPQGGTPVLADSKLIDISDITGPGTVGTATIIKAKQPISLILTSSAYVTSGGTITVEDSTGYALSGHQQPDGVGGVANQVDVTANVNLNKDEYVYVRKMSGTNTYGSMAITATPQTSPVVILESQDQIFTDWNEFTMTPLSATGGGTITKGTIVVDKAHWRRVGSNMEIMWDYKQSTTGASGTGNTVFPIPSGYAIDTGKLYVSDTTTYASVGTVKASFSASNGLSIYSANGVVSAENSTQLAMFFPATYNSFSRTSSTNFGFGGEAQLGLTMRVSIPIVGWNANFNPLLSMPLVSIGGTQGQYLQSGWGGTRNYRLYGGTVRVDDLQGMATVTQGSSTVSWQYNATVRHKVTMNVTAGLNGADSYVGILSGTSALVNDSSVAMQDASLNTARKSSIFVENGYVYESSACWIMEAGEMVTLGLSSATTPHTGDANAVVNIQAERIFDNSDMAHIIKPAVAILSEQVAGGSTASNAGGSSSAGFNQRRINTAEGETWFVTGSFDGINGTNVNWTLEPGLYEFDLSSTVYATDYSSHRLYDVTNSAEVPGSCSPTAYVPSGHGGHPSMQSKFTHNITSSTEFKIETYVTTGRSTDGLGTYNGNTANNSVFSTVKIRKLK